ncbi:hypothetical protein HMSSN036_31120 [Paenibacillus macerans]|nr:hypothetical protein HMSSN036_31120 [Paenibacillus macerans]
MKIVAPGWAYWPYKGIPDGWERDAEQRRPIEEIADITNGHSYGGTGVQPVPGGALYENLRVYPDADEGFGKEMAMSEAGANDNHADNTKYGTYAYRFAAAFDRELRGDIGYADHIMQHAAFFTITPISDCLTVRWTGTRTGMRTPGPFPPTLANRGRPGSRPSAVWARLMRRTEAR